MCSLTQIGYFIFIGILILSYVLLHGKTYQENKFNAGGIFLSKWGHRNILYSICKDGTFTHFTRLQARSSNITKYNITYLSRKELNSCRNLLVKFFEGNSLACSSFVNLKPSSMNFPKRMSCWSTADWTDNWWWRVSIILLLMLISCRIFDVNILKFGASTEMRFINYIDSFRVILI